MGGSYGVTKIGGIPYTAHEAQITLPPLFSIFVLFNGGGGLFVLKEQNTGLSPKSNHDKGFVNKFFENKINNHTALIYTPFHP